MLITFLFHTPARLGVAIVTLGLLIARPPAAMADEAAQDEAVASAEGGTSAEEDVFDEGASGGEDGAEAEGDQSDEGTAGVDMVIDENEIATGAVVESTPGVRGDEDGGLLASVWENDAVARRDRGVNILTAHAARKGTLTLVVDHRPWKNLFSGDDAFFDYLGLDRGESLKVGIGLRYGIIDGLDFGVYRLNDGGLVHYDTYEFDLRYAFLNQERHFVNLMVRAGLSWFTQDDADDALGYFAQLFVDRVLFDRVLVGVGFAYHSESSSEYKRRTDDAMSGAITGVLEWRALDFMAITAEVAATVFGYKQDYPSYTLALKFLTRRHTFSIMMTTSQFINADGIVANSWRLPKEMVFGFQIFREFKIADY